MNIRAWGEKQYSDIKGNAKWALLGILWTPIVAAVKALFHYIPHFPDWAGWVVIAIVSAIAFVWVAQSRPRTSAQAASQALIPQAGTPLQVPLFSFARFFQLSHTSQLTDDTEQRMEALVAQEYPNPVERERTLAKFIGIGYWGYMHDLTWAYIFRSQILALSELNSKGGIMPLANARAHYDQAKIEFPRTYSDYSFTDWLGFMTAYQLLIKHPTNMLEITLRGRDFLKYLTHYGMSADTRKN